jgi:hypothetical protein
MTTLAQFDSVPASIAAWLACLAFVLLLFNEAAKARKTIFGADKAEPRTIAPQPLDVREVSGYVREKDCQKRHDALDQQIVCQAAAHRSDIGQLHEKINGVAREVSELTTAVEIQGQRLAAIDAKLDRVIERQQEVAQKAIQAAVSAVVHTPAPLRKCP